MKHIRSRSGFFLITAGILVAAILFFAIDQRNNLTIFGQTAISQKALSRDYGNIEKAKQMLQDGDLVLRTGNDFTSFSLKQFSLRNKTYSHCGLVRIEHGNVYVYHALGGADNPDGRLRKDSFEQFCNPYHNNGFGIYRYNFSPATKNRLDSIVGNYYAEKIPFDMQFDLSTNNKFYCAEFVYKSLLAATENLHYLSTTVIKGFRYVAIDNLFLNSHAKPVCHYVFRK